MQVKWVVNMFHVDFKLISHCIYLSQGYCLYKRYPILDDITERTNILRCQPTYDPVVSLLQSNKDVALKIN